MTGGELECPSHPVAELSGLCSFGRPILEVASLRRSLDGLARGAKMKIIAVHRCGPRQQQEVGRRRSPASAVDLERADPATAYVVSPVERQMMRQRSKG